MSYKSQLYFLFAVRTDIKYYELIFWEYTAVCVNDI